MAVKIKFDGAYRPEMPTIVLANRNGHKLGTLPAINMNFADHMTSAAELQFTVCKAENGVRCALWDEIVDFRLVWCPEWDMWFEISVEIEDGNDVEKNVSGVALGEAELSQINLYGIEINTESDIARDDYVPTVLCNSGKKNASLLHRITEKAPHYTIGHVDASIANIQRTFAFDGTSIMDAMNAIGEEIDCLFVIDNGSDENGRPRRRICAYDLEANCLNCGHRGGCLPEHARNAGAATLITDMETTPTYSFRRRT